MGICLCCSDTRKCFLTTKPPLKPPQKEINKEQKKKNFLMKIYVGNIYSDNPI